MHKHLFFILISLIISLKGTCNDKTSAFLVKQNAMIAANNAVHAKKAYQVIAYSKKDNLPLADASHVQPKHQKLKAVILAITLGVFGVHRIYLGTSPFIPIAYTLTLGGFAILPLIDAINIIFSKDPDKYKNNRQFFMWVKNEKKGG